MAILFSCSEVIVRDTHVLTSWQVDLFVEFAGGAL